MDRVIEIGLRGGAWTELQNDTPLQTLRIQSDIPVFSSTNVNVKSTERPANTVPSSKDT